MKVIDPPSFVVTRICPGYSVPGDPMASGSWLRRGIGSK